MFWLTSLLNLDKYKDISSSKWNIFLKLFGDIPWILVHFFQIIVNFLYVCQSVSLLTSLLISDKYRDISSSGWDIFLNFFADIPDMFVHYFQMFTNFLHVCHSVNWLTSLLILDNYWDISSSGWDIFLKFSENIPGMLLH